MTERTDRDSVPRIAVTEDTHMASFTLTLLTESPAEPTVRLVKVDRSIDPGDSDGIPMQPVEVETSAQISSTAFTSKNFELTNADKIVVLMELCELAFRHGHPNIIHYPILTREAPTSTAGSPYRDTHEREDRKRFREPVVRFFVSNWHQFYTWFLDELAASSFEDMRYQMRNLTGTQRHGGFALLEAIALMLPNLDRHVQSMPPVIDGAGRRVNVFVIYL